MRGQAGRKSATQDLRLRVDALEHLPIRAVTARQVLASTDADDMTSPTVGSPKPGRMPEDLDPGWILARMMLPADADPLRLVAERAWWPVPGAVAARAESFQWIWRHTVAVGLAARTIARDRGEGDPGSFQRVGMLHGLGLWAVAAVDSDWLERWLGEPDLRARLKLERAQLGTDLTDLGRRLAERWGCEPAVVDAAWLHGPSSEPFKGAAMDPARNAIIREAYLWAESTPWSLSSATHREAMPQEPHLRILVAEVQSRCGSLFAAADATTHEEALSRKHARMCLQLRAAESQSASQGRLLHAIATSGSTETPEGWAARAGLVWCSEPEVTAARVAWTPSAPGVATLTNPSSQKGSSAETLAITPARGNRPSTSLLLRNGPESSAEIQLWCEPASDGLRDRLERNELASAWASWASFVAARADLEARLQAVVANARDHASEEFQRLQAAKLDALAEFAAGAGHELNNPLAVIVGRAQLLLVRSTDPELRRSLSIILNQAQRTHRILRDLMFVARPQPPRLRAVRPSEVLRTSLAWAREECDAQGLKLIADIESADAPAWADPDVLGQLADTLLRNAIQATPAGGEIALRTRVRDGELRLSVVDSGRGFSAQDASHLLDPFYCGRQAGRGLGLGLSRVARILEMAGGALTWSSVPGQGATFSIRLPLRDVPEETADRARADRVA